MDTPFSPIHARLNNRHFTVANNAHGLSGAGTVFHYLVEGDAISGTYQGGRIRMGTQVGRVTGADTIELLYQGRRLRASCWPAGHAARWAWIRPGVPP